MSIKLLPDLDTQKRIADATEEIASKLGGSGDGSSAEIIDARDGYPVLGDRLDFESYQEQRNAQNIAKRSTYNSHFTQTVRPLVTIIDDDGNDRVLTDLKNIADDYNIKIGVAVTNNSQIIVDKTKREQLLELQNDYGWEVLSHTMNHIWYGDMTPEQIEEDCKTFIETFNKYGFNIFNLVYPFSLPNNNTAQIVSKYYSSGFGTGSNYNTIQNINEYNIYRINIGANYEGLTNKTLEEYKDIVDEVIANNGWLVLMTHIGETNEDGMQLIRDVLDYVVTNEVEIVTPTEGLRVFGSVTQSGLKNENHFHIKSNGIVETNTYLMINRKSKLESDPATVTEATPNISVFPVSGWSLGAGIVTEYYSSNGYQYQEFKKTGSQVLIYMRKWIGSSWGSWYRLALTLDGFNITVPAQTINANSTINVNLFKPELLSRFGYIAQPTGQLEDGLVWSCWSYGDGAIRLRIANTTTSNISIAERVWKIKVLD